MTTAEMIERRMPAEDYFRLPGLSFHGMKDLAVSPLRYWFHHINPERPEREETAEMRFGKALHCAVLEPQRFEQEYCCDIGTADEIEGCLETIDDLREWLRDKGFTPKGTRKADLVAQVQAVDANVPIYDVISRQFRSENAGRTILSVDDWDRLEGAAAALESEPEFQQIIAEGEPEVCMSVVDPSTGVGLKARMDWVSPRFTLDLKTFTQQRGKSIDRTVADAVYYERYHWQAYLYSAIRAYREGGSKLSGAQTSKEFVIAFVESEKPHEVRLRAVRPKVAGQPSMLWESARVECIRLTRTYADCMDRFGKEPWRDFRGVEEIEDEQLPQLSYAR